MLYTIFSTRDDGRLLMLSNSLSISDEILQILGIQINKGYGIYINREKMSLSTTATIQSSSKRNKRTPS